MNSLGIPRAVDHFETIINVKGSTIDQVFPQVYFMWVCLCSGWDSFKGLAARHLPKKYHICCLCLQSKDCLFSWCKKPSAMPTLLDLLTEQLSTNNTHALASSSLAAMHLKTLQMQSDDPNNGSLRIKLTYLFPCLSE